MRYKPQLKVGYSYFYNVNHEKYNPFINEFREGKSLLMIDKYDSLSESYSYHYVGEGLGPSYSDPNSMHRCKLEMEGYLNNGVIILQSFELEGI